MGIRSFFGRIFKASNSAISDLLNPIWWSTDLWGGRKSFSGTRIDPSNALTLSDYYAILYGISSDLAKLPIRIYKKDGRRKTFLDNHPVWKLLNIAPNDDMTSFTYMETGTHHGIGWGNGYSEIERSASGTPLAIHPIHPSRTTPWRENGRIVYRVRAGGTGINGDIEPNFIELPPEDVLHIKNLGAVGYIGYSPVQLMSESLGLSMALRTYGATFFGNNATPGVIIKHPNKLNDASMKRLRESWQEQAGADNAHRPKVLEEGMSVDRLSIPPNEAQMLEARVFQLRDIARFLRYPLHKLGDLERATFSNIEQLNIEYYQDTLLPWSKRWCQEIKRKLFSEREVDIHVEHDFGELLKGDQAAQAKYVETRAKTGSMTINEMREFYGDDPIEGGDNVFVAVNMQPLDKALAEPEEKEPQDDLEETQEVEPIKESTRELKPVQANALNLSAILYPCAEDAAKRVLRKEQKALEKAAARYDTLESFDKWANDFYNEQSQFLYEAFAPIIAPAVDIKKADEVLTREAKSLGVIWKTEASTAFKNKLLQLHIENRTAIACDLAKCILEGIK